jgi:hypothetical protein
MVRFGGALLLVALSSPAFAAGGWEDMPTWLLAGMYLVFGLLFGLPSIGLGYFLQGLMSLPKAAILLGLITVAVLLGLAAGYGFEKTLTVLPLIALLLSIFSPLFGLGWFLGFRDLRRTARQEPA